MQPLRVYQLFEVRQLLQTVWLLQRIAQGGDIVEARVFQTFGDRLVVFTVAVKCDVGGFTQLMLLRPRAKLLVVHRGAAASGGV